MDWSLSTPNLARFEGPKPQIVLSDARRSVIS
jgi:hypothetical protein